MKMVVRRSIALAAGFVLAALGSSAEGAASTKFGAWSLGWYNSAIPLMLRAPSAAGPQLDVRQDRQYAGHCNMATLQAPAIPGATEGYCATMINAVVVPFALAHPGHHYVVGDEPDQYMVTSLQYAQWYRTFTLAVLAVDPSARFSPAGFAEPNAASAPEGHFTAYAQAFYTAYTLLPDNPNHTPPPVAEWRFNIGLSNQWQTLVDQAISWTQGKGAPVTFSFSHEGRPQSENVVPELQQFLAYVAPKSWVAHVDYFVYNPHTEVPNQYYNHALTTPAGALTPEGVAYMQYAVPSASVVTGGSPSPDFNGDGFADYADQWRDTNQFWIHNNAGNGSFGTALGPYFPSPPSSGFAQLGARFVGSAPADYADIHVGSRQAWIHARLADGSFDPPGTSSGYAVMTGGAAVDMSSSVEFFAADFDGNGKSDFAKRELATGLMWVYLNDGQTYAGFGSPVAGKFVARTAVGPNWRVLVGDFTGDGKADYADQSLASGTIYIHKNTGAPAFAMDSVNWRVLDQVTAGADWMTIVGDFTGDGWCDYADVYLPYGMFWVHKNLNAAPPLPLTNGGFRPSGQSDGFADAEQPPSLWRFLNAR